MGYVGAGFVVNQANTTDGGAINTVAYASTGASAGQYVGGAYAVNLYTGPFGTLSLDFINNYYAIVGVSKTFSQAITFSRASNATRFAPNGVLQYAPHNLLLQSQAFNNASWANQNTTETDNAATAPDGTFTAATLNDGVATGGHDIAGNFSGTSSATYTLSAFFKNVDRQFVILACSSGPNSYASAKFDLTAGTAGSTSASGAGWSTTSSSITSVGNSWYRCTITFVSGTTSTLSARLGMATDGTTFTASQRGLESYTGSNKQIYIWGAQLALGPYPLDYTPTTTAVVYGPRFDYDPVTLAPLGLLIEEQRTNLLTYSEQFDNAAWTKTQGAVTANTAVAPDGTITADFFVPTAGVSFANVSSATVAQAKNGTYTGSVYLKSGGFTFAGIIVSAFAGNAINAFINFSTGQTGVRNDGSASGATATATSVGNGWWRVSVSGIPKVGDATNGIAFVVAPAGALSSLTFPAADGTSGIYIWGAQLEAGAFATSYIPTLASTVTRSADVASINTLSPWYNQAEGSFFAEWRLGQDTSSIIIYQVDDGTNTNVIRLRYGAAGTSNDTAVIVGNVAQFTLAVSTQQTPNTTYKNAMAYKLNDFARSADGGVAITNNSGTLPTVTQLGIGQRSVNTEQPNGHIRRIAYYNRRLTNAELQALSA